MEGFFLIGCQVNEIELKELLLRRYHSLDFIEKMGLGEFVEFITLAIENDKKEKIETIYLALLPVLSLQGKYIPFNEFYDKMTGANLDLRSADEILRESEEIQERFKNKNGS